jgi:M6 family metalloprotease-like protein
MAGAPPSVELVGWLAIVHGDGEPGSGLAPRLEYRLVDELGGSTPLTFVETITEEQIAALSGQRVRVVGEWAAAVAAAGEGARPLVAAEITAAGGAGAAAPARGGPEALTGSQPWVSVMCNFPDRPASTKPLSYFTNMYASTKPGLDHYWREVSYDNINVLGSTAAGWFTLPQPRSYYVPGGSLNFGLLADDCTALADSLIYYPNFIGINLMFNDIFDSANNYAWGGSWPLNRDGVYKSYRMTWEPPWGYADITVMSHEMGHGFGLPHTAFDDSYPYNNQWDVMSDTWSNCGNSTDATYGCMGQHTISQQKDVLQWIPPALRFIAGRGTYRVLTLEQLALPSTPNLRMIKVLIGGSTSHYYTIEARRKVGYDVKLPLEGLIIHETNPAWSIQTHIIDPTGLPTGDEGAVWTPGETFLDSANGISVTVLSATGTGWVVRVSNAVAGLSFLPSVMR